PGDVDDFDQNERGGKSVDGGRQRGDELNADLSEMAVDQPAAGIAQRQIAARAVLEQRRRGKDAGEDGAQKAADAVNAESVESIVVLDERLTGDNDVADHAGNQAD